MRHKADNDSIFLKKQDTLEVSESTHHAKQKQVQHQLMRFKHQDSDCGAVLYFDDETALWIIEYTRFDQVISSALYQSESTAHLILRSHGYKPNLIAAC